MIRKPVIVYYPGTIEICTTNKKDMEQHFNYSNELSGKIALVTGGTKGAGKASQLLNRNNFVIDGGTVPTI